MQSDLKKQRNPLMKKIQGLQAPMELHHFVSIIEPKNIDEAINDEHWIITMQDELNQFERNQV